MHYHVRNSLAGKAINYTLDKEGISWAAGAETGRIAYREIDLVNLITSAGSGGEILQCRIKSRSGVCLTFRSRHFVGIGRFEDRLADYAGFVRELLRQVALKAPRARCTAGSMAQVIVWIALGVVLALGLLGAGIALIEIGGSGGDVGLWGFLLFALVAAPFVGSRIKRGSARRFDPANPPAELIGGEFVA